MKKTVAVVGLGPHGKRFIQCVLNDSRLELAAVVDRDAAKLNDVTLPPNVKRLAELPELWLLNIQVLLIATNGPSHAPIAVEAIEKGIRFILVTKPVATTLRDARLLQALAEKHHVTIAVDHGLRYDATYKWLKQTQREGKFGSLKSIYIQRPGIGLGCLGVHSFDLATYLAEAEIATVTAWVDAPVGKNPRGEQFVDPGGLVVLNYTNQVKAIISQIEEGAGPMSVELNYTKARIRVDEKFKVLECVYRDENKKFDLQLNPHQQPVAHDTIQLMSAVINDLVFGSNLNADVKWGILSFEVLLAAYLSSESDHRPVKLPITSEEAAVRFLPVT